MRDFYVFFVQREGSNCDKVGKLLDMLESRGPNAFDVFANALGETKQPHVLQILLDEVK